MSPDLAIEAKGLVKRYSEDVLAVDKIDLEITANAVYALLGPNGAGKTTTISMLTTLIEPTDGWAKISGFDVVRQASDVRRRIGVTFQETVLDEELTGRQVLDYHGRLYGQSNSRKQEGTSLLHYLLSRYTIRNKQLHRRTGQNARRSVSTPTPSSRTAKRRR